MKIIIILFSSLLLFSCNAKLLPVKANEQRVKLNSDNISKLNGSYEIVSTDTNFYQLDFILTFKDYFKNQNQPDSNDRMAIKVLDNTHIQIAIINDNKIVYSKLVKGRVINEYFEYSIKRISPFWFVINGVGKQTTRIGLLENGNLIADKSHGVIGFLVIMPFTGGGQANYDLVFKRKTE